MRAVLRPQAAVRPDLRQIHPDAVRQIPAVRRILAALPVLPDRWGQSRQIPDA